MLGRFIFSYRCCNNSFRTRNNRNAAIVARRKLRYYPGQTYYVFRAERVFVVTVDAVEDFERNLVEPDRTHFNVWAYDVPRGQGLLYGLVFGGRTWYNSVRN
jgi:hypothetical protein